MNGSKTEGNDAKRTIAFLDVVKIIAGLAVFIPVMTGILQYRQNILINRNYIMNQTELDKNTRGNLLQRLDYLLENERS